MVEKTAAFKQRRAADTRRWRERLDRGAACYSVEIYRQLFDCFLLKADLASYQYSHASRACTPGIRRSPAALCGERNHECFNCEPLASSAHSRRQRSQQLLRLAVLLGQALAGLDCRSLQRGQRGVLERRERAGVSILTRTGVNGDQPAFETHGHLEKFFSPSRYESDSLTAMGHGRMERASHGADGLFRC